MRAEAARHAASAHEAFFVEITEPEIELFNVGIDVLICPYRQRVTRFLVFLESGAPSAPHVLFHAQHAFIAGSGDHRPRARLLAVFFERPLFEYIATLLGDIERSVDKKAPFLCNDPEPLVFVHFTEPLRPKLITFRVSRLPDISCLLLADEREPARLENVFERLLRFDDRHVVGLPHEPHNVGIFCARVAEHSLTVFVHKAPCEIKQNGAVFTAGEAHEHLTMEERIKVLNRANGVVQLLFKRPLLPLL